MSADQDAFDRYTAKHRRLPPANHPDLGEFSPYMRAGGSFTVILVLAVGVLASVLAWAAAINACLRYCVP